MEPTMKKLLLSVVLALATQSAFAVRVSSEQGADPARWYVEDATPQAKFQTMKKEVDAAYKEAMTECKAMPAADRGACMKDARAIFQADMASAKSVLMRQ